MSCSQCRWSLGSLLLLLGGALGLVVEIHQDSINGTVGQAVLLPVSYRFSGAPRFPVSVRWNFSNNRDPLIACTIVNCSLGAGGAPSSCSISCFPHGASRGRAELFPENGSLLLQDLQLSDSGVYSVTFRPPYRTWDVTLTVQEQRVPPGHPANQGQDHGQYYAIGICSSVFLLLLFLLFCYIWHRGAAQQQRRGIANPQQVSSVEESHMESTVVRDVATVYARVGDSFKQPQPGPTPEVVYTSITSLGPPGLSTGP